MIDVEMESQLRSSREEPRIPTHYAAFSLQRMRRQRTTVSLYISARTLRRFLGSVYVGASGLSLLIVSSMLMLSTAYGEERNQLAGHDPQRILQAAEKSVEAAWDAFHRAALGGTLASPQLQMEIEAALGLARELVIKARAAGKAGREQDVKMLSEQIHRLCDSIIIRSQRRKP
ncbi:MAG: hypothetical protein D6690_08010 [Nitrospirae bacterium]|nr:MAG: hypothetical protein D6690_08010 [Nitrospirota bacterium]